MDNTTLDEIQQEIDLLESMYGGEVEDLRVKCLNKAERLYHTTSARLFLTPLLTYSRDRPNSHVMVTIKLETDNEYPNSPVLFTIEDYKGITQAEHDELVKLLVKESQDAAKKGAVVFYNICRSVKHFLHDNCRPERPSMHHSMMARQEEDEKKRKEQDEAEKQQQEEKELLRRRKLEEDNAMIINERRAVRRDAAQSREREAAMRSVSMVDGCSGQLQQMSPARMRSSLSGCDYNSFANFNTSVTLIGRDGKFRIIEMKELMKTSENMMHFTHEVVDQATKTKHVLHTWEIVTKRVARRTSGKQDKNKNLEDIRLAELNASLDNIEKEIVALMELSNPYIVEYEAYKIVREQTIIKVHLLQPFIPSRALNSNIIQGVKMSDDFIKFVARGCLRALSYLHQHEVVHRNLSFTNILLPQPSKGDIVYVADFSVEYNIYQAFCNFNNEEMPLHFPLSYGVDPYKKDVYRLGIILYSMAVNKFGFTRMPLPGLPKRTKPEFHSFFLKFLCIHESLRWPAERILTHAVFTDTSSDVVHLNTDDITGCQNQAFNDNKKPLGRNRRDSLQGRKESENELVQEEVLEPAARQAVSAGNSRLEKDFSHRVEIGRGGFGRVYKVRNGTDQRYYALKRISLHQESEDRQHRILREVQCLSALNHEHVVRYYTSWIEGTQCQSDEDSSDDDDDDESFSEAVTAKNSHSQKYVVSVSYQNDQYTSDEEASSSDDEGNVSDDEDNSSSMTKSYPECEEEESDFVVFDKGDASNVDGNSSEETDLSVAPRGKKLPAAQKKGSASAKDSAAKKSVNFAPLKKQFLYIQMEFCENKTLRHAIDDGLYKESARLWRLFREMVRGLDYIHSLNLVHRDLKPGNIFIDYNNQVKIGDFGLATVVRNTGPAIVDKGAHLSAGNQVVASDSSAIGITINERSSNVGTYFYIAPEVATTSSKCLYTTKFDIYSLGIIFFEMVCILPKSGHERVEILNKVRLSTIELPPEFEKNVYATKKDLVKWLLNHDPMKRPSASDLLKSDILPPLSTEEKKFQEKLETALEKCNSEFNSKILMHFFKPREVAMKELTFMHQNQPKKRMFKHIDLAADFIQSVFRAHGGIWRPAPQFMPKGCLYKELKDKKEPFNVVTDTGMPMSCCMELRYPFARLVAIQDIQNFRRYCIDRVQRLPKLKGDFPFVRFECAFDFIGEPRERKESCARIMKVCQDVIKPLAEITRNLNNVTIDVTYMPLSKAILSCCGVGDDCIATALGIIKAGLREEHDVDTISNNLLQVCNKKTANALKRFIGMSGPVEEVLSKLQPWPHRSNVADLESKVAELRLIVSAAETLGVEFKMNLQPLLVPDGILYCKFMCQFMWKNHASGKKFRKKFVLAEGGVFDHLVLQHRERLPASQVGSNPLSAVGISISLELLVDVLFASDSPVPVRPSTHAVGCGGPNVSVLVAYVGGDAENMPRLHDQVKIVNALRIHNVSADFTQLASESDLYNCITPYVVLINEDNPDKLTIKHTMNFRGFWSGTKLVPQKDVVECLLQMLSSSEQDSSSKPNLVTSPAGMAGGGATAAEESIEFEVVPRRANKQKESLRSDEQSRRMREVKSLISRAAGSYRGYHLLVLCMDLERDVMLQLSTLDLESTTRNYNDSLEALKNRLSSSHSKDIVEYVERCAKIISKRVEESRRSSDTLPFSIIGYSSPSESYKKLYWD